MQKQHLFVFAAAHLSFKQGQKIMLIGTPEGGQKEEEEEQEQEVMKNTIFHEDIEGLYLLIIFPSALTLSHTHTTKQNSLQLGEPHAPEHFLVTKQ